MRYHPVSAHEGGIFIWWLSAPSSCAASKFKSSGFLQMAAQRGLLFPDSYFRNTSYSMGGATERTSEVGVLFRGLLAEIIAQVFEASLDKPILAWIGMI